MFIVRVATMASQIKAVGYVRVSTKEQSQFSDGHVSLVVQERVILDWCEANGVNLVKIFKEVVSARDMKKQKELLSLSTFVRTNSINLVVVYNISRFSRNTYQGLEFINRKLLPRGANIVSVQDGCRYQNTAGKNVFTMTLCFGENQSNVTSDNIKSTHSYLRNLGFQFGQPPYGMKAIRVPSIANPSITVRKFERDDDEQAVIQQILSSTTSFKETAEYLNSQLILRKGKPWTYHSVRAICVNNSVFGMGSLSTTLPMATEDEDEGARHSHRRPLEQGDEERITRRRRLNPTIKRKRPMK